MIKQRFSIKQVTEMTGLEESDIRFYENIFREFLSFTSMELDHNEFTPDHIELIKRIKELIRKRGFTVQEVKKDLRNFIQRADASKQTVAPAKGAEFARVIAVTSGKGGVGKTSLTVNLAISDHDDANAGARLQGDYLAMVKAHLASLEKKFADNRIDYTLLDTSNPLDEALFAYLLAREKMGKTR